MKWKITLEFTSDPAKIDFVSEEIFAMLKPVLQYELFPGHVIQIEKTSNDFSQTHIWRYGNA